MILKFNWECEVIEDLAYQLIVGLDWINANGVLLDIKNQVCKIRGKSIPICTGINDWYNLRIVNTIKLEGETTYWIPVKVPNLLEPECETIIHRVTPKILQPWAVTNSLNNVKGGLTFVELTNWTSTRGS